MTQAEQHSTPLISIVVLTYNSASTVQETLDSIARQEYPELEVLVCDDGSTDSTLEIVRAWFEQRGRLFKRTELIPSTANEGICKNLAKGYAAARGDWLKPIAGDDLLEPQAIRRFAAVAALTDHDVIVAMLKTFSDDSTDSAVWPNAKDLALIAGPPERLRAELRIRNLIPAPSVLVRREAYESVGGIDTTFKHLDDWPLWVNFVEAGKSFGLLPEVLVQYRVSPASITKRRPAVSINKDFLEDLIRFYEKYQRRFLSPLRRWDRSIEIFRCKLAKGALRPYPGLYRATRLLHALSPLALMNLLNRSD